MSEPTQHDADDTLIFRHIGILMLFMAGVAVALVVICIAISTAVSTSGFL